MSLLSKDQLDQRIFCGPAESVIRRDWARRGNLRWAGYDLRIAGDHVVQNGIDTPFQDRMALEPGDVASVSTFERFCMPWDLAANIGVKFSLAQQGLLVFTGLLVDPGFGMRELSQNIWVPMDDERLHFFIANLGAARIDIRLGAQG